MTVAEQLGLNLRSARRRAGLSQEGLCRRAGLHRTEIGLLELGRRVPRLDTFIRIFHVLDADPGDLLRGVTWHEPSGWDAPGWYTIIGLSEPADVRASVRTRQD